MFDRLQGEELPFFLKKSQSISFEGPLEYTDTLRFFCAGGVEGLVKPESNISSRSSHSASPVGSDSHCSWQPWTQRSLALCMKPAVAGNFAWARNMLA